MTNIISPEYLQTFGRIYYYGVHLNLFYYYSLQCWVGVDMNDNWVKTIMGPFGVNEIWGCDGSNNSNHTDLFTTL